MHRRSLAMIAVVALAACGHRPAPGESVEEVCTVANDGRTVAVSGTLVAPLFTIGCTESCTVYLSADGSRDHVLALTVPVGHGPRTMNAIQPLDETTSFPGMVEELDARAYVLRDDAGNELALGDAARVRGVVRARARDGQVDCSIDPTGIQRAE